MSEYSQLLGPDRWALIKSGSYAGQVGKILYWDHGFEMWLVDVLTHHVLKDTEDLEPVFTMDQIVNVKLQEQAPGGDLMEKTKAFGMSSEDLADATEEFIAFCSNRIKGVGDKQYSEDGFQKFEAMDLNELLEYIKEEIGDIPNYCTMLYIRIMRLQQALEMADIIEEKEESIE